MGHYERLEAGTQTSLVQMVRTLLGVPAIVAWARFPSIPRTLVFSLWVALKLEGAGLEPSGGSPFWVDVPTFPLRGGILLGG